MGIREKFNLGEKDKKLIWKLGIVVLAALFLLIFSNYSKEKTTPLEEAAPTTQNSEDMRTELENDLEAALSQVSGAGAVTVEIKWSGSTEKEYAYNSEESEQQGETNPQKSSKKEMVLTDSGTNAVVIKENMPAIDGVLIVAEGAYDPAIRETLLNAAITFLDIGANRIQIARKG